MANEKRVVIPADMGKTIEFGSKESDKWNVKHDDTLRTKPDGSLSVVAPASSGGLDCNTIQTLPQKPWKKGTSVLGQQDGKCVRLVPTENLFQEIGVALSANKLMGFTQEAYHVITTVTNSGEATNALTDLVITKPLLGSYTVSNVHTTASPGATIEKVSDFVFKIKNLGSGGTAKVEFDVTPTSAGSFQFGANVNPNTALDMESNNNAASIILSARIRADVNTAVTVDCPLIRAVDVTSNKQLQSFSDYEYSYARVQTLNVYEKAGSIKVKLPGATSVVVARTNIIDKFSNVLSTSTTLKSDFKYAAEAAHIWTQRNAAQPFKSLDNVINDYTWENSILTVSLAAGQHCVIAYRGGANCKWQYTHLCVLHPVTVTRQCVLTSTAPFTTETASPLYTEHSESSERYVDNTIDTNKALYSYTSRSGGGGGIPPRSTVEVNDQKIVVQVPKGVAKTYTVSATACGSITSNQKGRVAITPTASGATISVAAGATSADNVQLGKVEVKVV